MIEKIITMNGAGLFVWPSFAITFIVCTFVFLKTQRTLKKYEREYAKEINQLSADQKKSVLENSKIASQVLSSYSKTA
jgi:heme exporter protein CcmD|tara:strand:- start:643 stop:876 length:234 start_codon:yes stop_codon:yes gene_type:complete